MRKLFTYALLITGLCTSSSSFGGTTLWQQVPVEQAPSQKIQVFHPNHYLVYTFNEAWVKLQLFSLSANPDEGTIIELPMPDGSFRNFKVWDAPMMPDELAAKYPDIKTFTGEATDDRRVTAKLDFTCYGFHAMIFDGDNTSFVDPYDLYHDGYYMVHYKRDEVRQYTDRMRCQVKTESGAIPGNEGAELIQAGTSSHLEQRTVNGWNLRTYRLALSADAHYCQAATGSTSPTIAACLACMTTSMNRINGVYEREFSVHMNFCTHEDTLIWPTHTGSVNGTDPFWTIDNNGNSCLTQNQPTCTGRIGSANFDLGHVFTTGGGGISSLGVVCSNGSKAQSCTGLPTPVGDGFDIDYVAHEMGHEFGANHPFNNGIDGSCGGGNANQPTAYEPGSASTIMGYAGICDPDDLQLHSDAYFHAVSLNEIITKLMGSENACAVSTSTANKLVSLPAFTASYVIPYKTPFELIGPSATDSVSDTANTYCWEQWNLGDFGKELVQTFFRGPIFRSYNPAYTSTRVCPKIAMVLSGQLSNAGTELNEGEKVPDTARFLTFKMTVRDILNGNGCVTFPDDTIHIDAKATSTFKGFSVTSQNTTGLSYTGGTAQTVTWDNVGSNAAPVSCANVIIYMSVDGGNTWPYTVGTFPNTGTASVTVPNPTSTTPKGRFKVKGSGNIFFNVNKDNFTVVNNPSLPSGISTVTAQQFNVNVYPNPATETLNINTDATGTTYLIISNSVGQQVYKGQINGHAEIKVSSWAKGIYFVQAISTEGRREVKSIIVE